MVLAAPVLALLLVISPRARREIPERLRPLPRSGRPTLWLHAASVGEAELAAPVLSALLEKGVPVVATVTTRTGRATLQSRFPRLAVRLAPLDLPGLIQTSVRHARVAVLLLIETEIWPNAIAATAGRGGRVLIASARISDRSFPGYRRARALFRVVLERVAWIGAQTEGDARRLVALGARSERCEVTGDLKLDRDPAPLPSQALRAAIGAGPLLVGGSTHPGEEEALLDAWSELRDGLGSDLRLVLVPRHPDRSSQVLATARRFGADVGLRSEGAADAAVVVVDSVGELGTIYHLADLVFAGGSLVPIGGHNLLEPVRAGKVVVHGPHVENQRAQCGVLEPLGVLTRVETPGDLSRVLAALWADPARNRPAELAAETLAGHRGAIARTLEVVTRAYQEVVDAVGEADPRA